MKLTPWIFLLLLVGPMASADTTFMGLNADTVMFLSGNRLGQSYPCSNQYNRGSIANKWCHGAIAKTTKSILTEKGASELVGHIGGLAVLTLWELTNIRFDPSDIITAPVTVYTSDTAHTAISADLSGGMLIYINIKF